MGWEEAHEYGRRADLLHDAEAVAAAFERMAAAITERLAYSRPLILGVMIGGIVPTGRLLPLLDFPLEVDYVHATRYRGDTHGQELVWLARPTNPLSGRTVLIVDDILDEGRTLHGIIADCRARGARNVCSAVLVDKRHDRKYRGIRADFVGLEVEDRYVFGVGMDYRGHFRNAPGIYAIPDGAG